MPGAIRWLPVEVLGIGQRRGSRPSSAPAKASGSATRSARRLPSASAIGLRSATKATARAVTGDSPTVGSAASTAVVIARPRFGQTIGASRAARAGSRSAPGARACGPRRPRHSRPSAVARTSPSRADDPAGGVDQSTPAPDDPALGADRLADRHRPAVLDRHPGRDAPVVLGHERPGHDLVEDRRDDPAVGDVRPSPRTGRRASARSTTGARRCGARSRRPCVVELAAGEAVVRLELEARHARRAGLIRRRDLRRQGSAPCAPRS